MHAKVRSRATRVSPTENPRSRQRTAVFKFSGGALLHSCNFLLSLLGDGTRRSPIPGSTRWARTAADGKGAKKSKSWPHQGRNETRRAQCLISKDTPWTPPPRPGEIIGDRYDNSCKFAETDKSKPSTQLRLSNLSGYEEDSNPKVKTVWSAMYSCVKYKIILKTLSEMASSSRHSRSECTAIPKLPPRLHNISEY